MKQTAAEWLYGYLKMNNHIPSTRFNEKGLEQAKEMEKEQHLKTWTEGLYCETGDKQAFEQYYNETFKSE
jgi:hypothetical protein